MSNLRSFQSIGLVAALGFAGSTALADLEVTTSVQIHARADFERPLATHGTWVEFGSYGRCWRPGHIAVGWRPYCSGEWVWTDCGWYWASDEPWAWACYHYGCWVEDPVLGWVWVPGIDWAPAWVSWRVGGGYIGWAPLPPQGHIFVAHPRESAFVFVGEARFGGPIRPGLVVFKDAAVFRKTIALGAVQRETRRLGSSGPQKVMVNVGPSPERVQKATGKRFAVVSIRDAAERTHVSTKHSQPGGERKSEHGGSKADENQLDHGRSTDTDQAHGSGRGSRSERSGFDSPGRSEHSSRGGGHGRH